MLKNAYHPGEIPCFPRYPIGEFWHGIASSKTSREVTSRGWVICKVTSGVAWHPVSHMCVRVSDLWHGMASHKSVTCVFKKLDA